MYVLFVANENTYKYDGNNPTAALSIKVNKLCCLHIDSAIQPDKLYMLRWCAS